MPRVRRVAISDRIRVYRQPAAGLDHFDALAKYGATVQAETLSVALNVKPPEEADRVVAGELENGVVAIVVQ